MRRRKKDQGPTTKKTESGFPGSTSAHSLEFRWTYDAISGTMIINSIFILFTTCAHGAAIMGMDPIDLEGTSLARCRFFYPDAIGACEVQSAAATDLNVACGSEVNPCPASVNGVWDYNKMNCGKCYRVRLDHLDGTFSETYIKVFDTFISDTVKFELSQAAWANLCPFACREGGKCVRHPSLCHGGVLTSKGSCGTDAQKISFVRYECHQDVTAPVASLKAPAALAGGAGMGEDVCRILVGNVANPQWDLECKNLCQRYKRNPLLCHGYPDLVACVTTRHSYCKVR